MRNWAVWVFALMMVSLGTAYAVDLNNDGVSPDEIVFPGIYAGPTDRDEVVTFPTSQDTWQMTYYPYWWNYGDTVYGTHTVPLGEVTHADITLYLTYNSLVPGCGFCTIDFRIAGTTVGTFQVFPEDGYGPINASFDFAPKAPPFELRYFEVTTVAGGCGSITLDESGRNTISFRGGPSPTVSTTWGEVKALFQ